MLSMSKVNKEALASAIYNPSLDKKALALQQIMEKTTVVPRAKPLLPPLIDPNSVDADLRDHVATFNSLSPFNSFQGVVVNPTTCIIDEARDAIVELPDVMGDILTNAPEHLGAWNAIDYDDNAQEISSGLDICEEHTDRLTSNLPSLAGIAQAALGLTAVMNLLSNPCLGLDGMLGSIMDSGKALLNSVSSQVVAMLDQAKEALADLTSAIASGISSAISAAKAAIGPMINDIKDAMSVAAQAVSQFINKAKEEVMNFAKAMLAQLRQGLSELLANLPDDPCLRGLLGSVATGAAAAVIGG